MKLTECFFGGKCKSGFPNPKTDVTFFFGGGGGVNPTTDHESIKFTLRVDSWHQLQIRIFAIHNLSGF